MVMKAIVTLKERSGSSLPAIKKYIGANYKVRGTQRPARTLAQLAGPFGNASKQPRAAQQAADSGSTRLAVLLTCSWQFNSLNRLTAAGPSCLGPI
jgi:hypothetical protein